MDLDETIGLLRQHLAITRWDRHAAQPAQAQGKTFSEGKKTLPSGIGKTERQNPQQGRGEELDPSGDDCPQIV